MKPPFTKSNPTADSITKTDTRSHRDVNAKRVFPFALVVGLGLLPMFAVPNASAQKAAPGNNAMPPLAPARPLTLPRVAEETLPNGLKLVILEDHTQPALWMHLAIPAGSTRDTSGKVGLASMTANLITQGTTTRSATQIAETVDGLGASLNAGVGADFLSVSASGLSAYGDTLFTLLADVTLNPTFPTEELERARTQTLNSVTASLAQPATIASAALNRVVYGAHPYGNFSSGTPQTITALTRDEVVKFHDTYFAPNAATLFLVGDITPTQAREKALAAFGSWAKKDVPAPPAKPVAPAGAAKPQITIIDRPGAAQTEVRVGVLTTGYNDPNRVVGSVATAVLGLGQFEGRLTREIRVKRGLTYGAASFFDRHKDAGEFEISTFTKNASTAEVVKLALDEARKISADPIPADELKDRKTFLQGSFAVSVATPTGVLTRLVPAVLYGGGPGDLTRYTERVGAVTGGQIADIMRGLRLNAPQIVLVGDAKAIQKDVEPLGTVRVIPAGSVDLQSPTLEGKKEQGTGNATDNPAKSGAKATPADMAEGKTRLAATIKAHGGDAFLNVKSIVLKGKGELSDPTGQFPGVLPIETLTITLVSPDKVRADLESGFPILLGSEGGEGGEWMILAGTPKEAPAGVSSALNPVKLLRDAYTKNYPVSALPNDAASPNESGYAVTNPEGRLIRVYVDPTTNLAVRMVLPAKTGDVTVLLGKYKDTQGVQLPGTLKVIQGNVTYLNLTFSDMTVNTPVDATIFARPKA
jgi:predicted Zn-dependent peptidase